MLADNVREWSREWVERGRAEGFERGRAEGLERGRVQGLERGRAQGIKHSLEQERALLCRQAALKFDAGAAEGLAIVLAEATEADHLARVGDWIIESATVTGLLDASAATVGWAGDVPSGGRDPLTQLGEMQKMLEGDMEEWTRAWTEHGRTQGIWQGRAEGLEQGRAQSIEQGRVQGIEQGLEQERALLCRQAGRKFNPDAAKELADLLDRVADADYLAWVGEWIIECASASDLLTRVRRGVDWAA